MKSSAGARTGYACVFLFAGVVVEMYKTDDGQEVYENAIETLFLKYFTDRGIDPYKDKIEHNRANAAFMDIYDHLFKPDKNMVRKNNKKSLLDYSDIDTLNDIARIFIKLCNEFNLTPWLYMYSSLTGIAEDTLISWGNGEYRGKIYYDMQGNVIKDIQLYKARREGEYREEVTDRHSALVKNIRKAATNSKKARLSDSDIGNITQANNDEEIGLLYAQKEAKAIAEAWKPPERPLQIAQRRQKAPPSLPEFELSDNE